MATPTGNNVDQIFIDICASEESLRRGALDRLHNYVTSCRSSATSTLEAWEEDVGKNLPSMVNSASHLKRRGAVLAIDALLDVIKEDAVNNRGNLFRFYNHLTALLRKSHETTILVEASQLLGKLTQISGNALGDRFIEDQIPLFLEMGFSDLSSSYAAVLVMKELARHSPMSFFPHLSDTFRTISTLLRNAQIDVRIATAQLMGYLLNAMTGREFELHMVTITSVITRVQQGLEASSPAILHGSLLAFQELFLCTYQGLLSDRFLDMCEAILRFRSHPDAAVRGVVIEIVPILARYDLQAFCDHFFLTSVSFLVERLDSSDGPTAYLAIGRLSSAVGVKMSPFIEPIFKHVRGAIHKHGREACVLLDRIFETIGLLARSLGPAVAQTLNAHLDLIFTCELTQSCVRMLEMVVQHIPVLLGVVQGYLLDVLSLVLVGQHFRPQGASKLPPDTTVQWSPKVPLALGVLRNFDFKGHVLNEFIVRAVIPHLDDEDAATRKVAALTACRLLSKDPIRFQSSHHSAEVIAASLDKLLSVSVVDPDPEVRQAVLSSLETSLDYQLAQAEYIRLLVIALHDEVVSNRILVIQVVGRLARHNPGQALPPLRKTLIRLLTELKCSVTQQSKEVAIRILAAFLMSTHAVVEQHVMEVLRVVLDCAGDSNAVVTTHALTCLGQLSAVRTTNIVSNHIPKIMPIIMDSLSGSSQMRSAALDCLGRLCTNLGYVIAPIEDYPQLLPTLHGMLKREQSPSVRLQVVKVIGLLGALDPDRYQTRVQGIVLMESPPELINAVPDIETMDAKRVATPDDPHQETVVKLLLDILRQPSQSSHHHLVVDSLISIAKTSGVKFAGEVPKIIPTFCSITRGANPNLQGYYLGQLDFLIRATRQHIRSCVLDIIELIHEIWDSLPQRFALVVLVEALATALAFEFGPHVPRLLPRLLLILQEDKSDTLAATQVRVLAALTACAPTLQEYLNLVVPVVISCYEGSHIPPIVRKQAIQTLTQLSHSIDLYPYTSRIIHSLMFVIPDPDEQLRQLVVDALYSFTYTLGSSFVIFVPGVLKTLTKNNYDVEILRDRFTRLVRGEALPPLERVSRMTEEPPTVPTRSPNRHLLKRAWDVSRVLDSHDAWITWFTQLTAQLIKESPSVSLCSCMNLIDVYPRISPQLFCPALASCWGELTEPFQEDFIQSLQHVVSSPSVPPEVAHYMLDLVEYMERIETPLPISNGSMADYCFNLQAYAKALHHRELQFFKDFAPSTIEGLIDTYAMLRQSDAALGTLKLAQQHYNVRNPESWYEKLGQWSDGLELYDAMDKEVSRPERGGDYGKILAGRMRCLHALGEWEQVTTMMAEEWPHIDSQLQSTLAPLGAAGAWHTGEWKALETYCSGMERDSGDRAFYGAILSIQRNRLSYGLASILKARDLLDPELTSLLDESPDRLDRFAVQAQMISELEEMVLYKGLADRPHLQQRLRETWKKRLMGCQRDVNVWQRILKVRSLAVNAEDDIDTIVRFANLCRKSGRLGAARRAVESLVQSVQHESKAPPQIVYAQLKLIWANGDRTNALMSLRKFIEELSGSQLSDQAERETLARILARCHLKHGNWQAELDGGLTPTNARPILMSYRLATNHDPKWSKAWHTWALSNLDIIRNTSNFSAVPEDYRSMTRRTTHIVAAIEGFFRSLALMGENALQDTLSLLTLWFKFGAQSEITTAMTNGFKAIACDTWLDVVPQIIARIQTPIPIIREALTRLLTDIGLEHPQALVYPLTVGAKSPSLPRKMAALKILDQMSSHSRSLVEQARLVARELSRVAISWGELWHEGLQRSGRYYSRGDSRGMLDALQPLYDSLQNPSTPFEIEFRDILGPTLENARTLCRRHITDGDKRSFDQAWTLFLRVYHQLDPHIPEIQATTRRGNTKSLDLHSVSPQLLHAVNMELAVPGTYQSGCPIIQISSFKHDVPVIGTKQRPRQLVIIGNNGQRFVYLLKGREDLRQDERVIQVIGLVNTLLARDRESLNRRLHLQRYTVIPVAPDVGLIGWMAGTDTLQNLIIEYRKAHKILPDLEHRMILQDEPEYDTDTKIPLLRKVEVFESAIKRTTGQDLYRIFWLKSDNSEDWVTRRTTYTRSLAVGNMTGYLLGVGDRHPGNIMIGRDTGKVIHIDFGDCFEVSFERDSLPEKVPFRLTRMLRHAMEVCGIQGGFKTSCEISMIVLRDNKESLLAVLEAFVYDPFINWRLVQADSQAAPEIASSFGSTTEGPNRRTMLNENEILDVATVNGANREIRNERALAVYSRVEDKLTGRDFGSEHILSVTEQIDRLVQEATSNENLCQLFHGWCPFW